MPIHKIISMSRALEVLNQAIEADAGAMKTILQHNVVVNRDFASQFHCNFHNGTPVTSLMNLLNAIFGFDAHGKGTIAVAVAQVCPNCGHVKNDEIENRECLACIDEETGGRFPFTGVPLQFVDLEMG